MLIRFVELQNFRKLKSIRIDFDEQQTLLFAADNSGKRVLSEMIREARNHVI